MPSDGNRRLLLAIGAVLLPAVGDALADTGDSADSGDTETACVPWTAEVQGACPRADEVNFSPSFGTVLKPVDPHEAGTFADGQCCYLVRAEGMVLGCGCNHGRALLIERVPRKAGVARVDGWFDARLPKPDVAALNPRQRVQLARYWASVAVNEHASIASFHRVALELLALGAPEALITEAQRAAADELRHARRAFTLASRFAGVPIGPTPLRLDGLTLASSLPEFGVRTAQEGCVEETLSVGVATAMRARATDPAVRQVLTGIVADETRHAVYAWRLVRWVGEVGGAEARAAIRDAIFDARDTAVLPDEPDREPFPDDLGAWGLVADAGLQEAARRTRREVVDPLVTRLCG